jgi:hypothetical protein
MILFLQSDTSREHPVGYEAPRLNIFDPAEDDEEDGKSSTPSAGNCESIPDTHVGNGNRIMPAITKGGGSAKESGRPTCCAREGCIKKPRFDSLFCSDSCGISCMESDLLSTFFYSSDMHPSVFRQY